MRPFADVAGRPVQLLSPVPPMRTGTAAYLDTVLSRIAAVPSCADAVVVGIDPEFLPPGEAMPETLHGIPVVDFRDLPADVPPGHTRLLCLANNDHHAFVFESLRRQGSRAGGKIVALLHDPACFMINRFMTGNGIWRQTVEDLDEAVRSQYGPAGSRLLKARLDGSMPDIFEFVTHAQHLALTKTHEIWVHSLFGLVKLLGESTLQASRFPKIRVCRHPEPHGTAAPAPRADDGVFRIGVFGYVTAPKRVTSVIRGLALACDRLGSAAKPVELVVVGRIPHDTIYDPVGEAARFDVADRVRFVDYPSAGEFTRLQSDCDLIFNLRFPSCGESSGTLAMAAASGAMVVTSRYQAFHEAPGDRSVTVLPVFEDWMIASIIGDAVLARGSVAGQPKRRGRSSAPVEKLLLAEVLARAAQRNARLELS